MQEKKILTQLQTLYLYKSFVIFYVFTYTTVVRSSNVKQSFVYLFGIVVFRDSACARAFASNHRPNRAIVVLFDATFETDVSLYESVSFLEQASCLCKRDSVLCKSLFFFYIK